MKSLHGLSGCISVDDRTHNRLREVMYHTWIDKLSGVFTITTWKCYHDNRGFHLYRDWFFCQSAGSDRWFFQGGATRMARGGIRLVHGLTKSTLITYYSGMKKDPKYAFLHAFFLICLSCAFQICLYAQKHTLFSNFARFCTPKQCMCVPRARTVPGPEKQP